MFDSTYVSCPRIAWDHTMEIVFKAFNAVNGSPQWDVQYPTPEPMMDGISEAEYDQFVDDVAAEMEDQDAQCCDHGECIICSQPSMDEDHCIVRPDDDLAEEGANSAFESNAQYKASEMWNNDEFDEPACGDCGGCCECLGDPEVEPHFDTLREYLEEFYREDDSGFNDNALLEHGDDPEDDYLDRHAMFI